jgi:hypothetical protein
MQIFIFYPLAALQTASKCTAHPPPADSTFESLGALPSNKS